MSDKTQLLQKFSKAVTQFLDELIEQFPHESDLLVARVMIVNGQIPIQDIVDEFMGRILPHEKKIKDREDKFFLEDMNIFQGVDGDTVIKFKKLWVSEHLDDDDKDAIWKWCDLFVRMLKSYKNL